MSRRDLFRITPMIVMIGIICSYVSLLAHSFPPDIGQGINAGLCDVVQFDRTLRSTEGNIGAKLRAYERIQGPEVCHYYYSTKQAD